MVREYLPYIEAGKIGVDRHLALGICQGVNDIMSSFIDASIDLSRLDTINLNQPGNTLDPYALTLPDRTHRVLLTLRSLDSKATEHLGGGKAPIAGICIWTSEKSLSIVSVHHKVSEHTLDTAVGALTHEIVHSFGVCQPLRGRGLPHAAEAIRKSNCQIRPSIR